MKSAAPVLIIILEIAINANNEGIIINTHLSSAVFTAL